MKNKSITILILSIGLVLIYPSCNRKQAVDPVLEMPTEIVEHDFSLSDIATDLSFIPISYVDIMQPIYEIKYFDPFYYIKTQNNKLYRIQEDGKVLDVLDNQGRGPGEYLGINSFHVNSNDEVIINTATEKRLMIYDNSLNFKKSIPYPKEVEESYLFWINDTPYFFPLPIGKPSKYDWISIDTAGNVENSKLYEGSGITIYHSTERSLQVFGSSEVLYRYRETSDTIFKIHMNGYEPEYSINRNFIDGLRMSTIEEATRNIRSIAELTDITSIQGKRNIAKIFDLGLHWIIQYRSENSETILLNREENRSYLIGSGKGLPKLRNDFIGAGDIWIRTVIEINKCRYLVSFMDAYEFKSLAESDDFINGNPLLPAKKKEMELIAAGLSNSDNPILILLKLK